MLYLISMAAVAQQPTLEWAKRFDGTATTNASDKAVAIAVDDAGNSYVTGISQENGNQRIATVKYTSRGQQVWAVQFEEGATAVDVAVDNAGGVYVTGTSNGDYLSIRYNAATGGQVWVQHYDGGEADEATDIVVDNAGGVYITGSSLNNASDYITIRYNAETGERTWVQPYGATQDSDDKAVDLAVDKNGGVYVTGFSVNQTSTYNLPPFAMLPPQES